MHQGAPLHSRKHVAQRHPLFIPLEAMLERNLKPSDIVTKKSFENAIVLVNALGRASGPEVLVVYEQRVPKSGMHRGARRIDECSASLACDCSNCWCTLATMPAVRWIHSSVPLFLTEIELNIDDFQRISDKTSLVADLKPSGKYRMEVHGLS